MFEARPLPASGESYAARVEALLVTLALGVLFGFVLAMRGSFRRSGADLPLTRVLWAVALLLAGAVLLLSIT